MLKLHAAFSKKVPAEEEFSSQSYHAAVDVELPDGLTGPQLQERIHATFELVRESVEAELRGAPSASAPAEPSARPPRQARRPSSTAASAKQLGFLTDLGARCGLSPRQLDDEAHRQFGITSIHRLTRAQASQMIDSLGSDRRAA